MNLPRQYAHINADKPPGATNYESLDISWGNFSNYIVTRKIGKGRFSEVFEGYRGDKNCVIKTLKPIKPAKINKEIKILQILAGGPNIISLYDLVRDPVTKSMPCLIFESVNNIDFREFYPTLTDFDIRYYLYQILRTLDYCHSLGIMHRDIKPHNTMIEHETRKLRIIDWGCAEFYYPSKEYEVRVGSRYTKGPELLVNHRTYNYAMDIWAVGCMMAGMVFWKEPFLFGADNNDQLVKIVQFLGADGLFAYIEKYGLQLDQRALGQMRKCKPQSLQKYMNSTNQHLCSDEAFDLLSSMLKYDSVERPTASEALQHPYFAPVVQMYQQPDQLQPGTPERETAQILGLI